MTADHYFIERIQEVQALCRDYFELPIDIVSVLPDDIETGEQSYCTLFKARSGELFGLFVSDQPQTLADVRHDARAIGVDIKGYAYPFGDRQYFKRKGYEIFKRAYPGRHQWTLQEASYYQTLVAYSPALVMIAKTPYELRRYNPNYGSKWQTVSRGTLKTI